MDFLIADFRFKFSSVILDTLGILVNSPNPSMGQKNGKE
jgi:hypothetical protein